MHSIALKPDRRHQRRAFTLVEMLIVIAVMSILMTAGAIGLSGMGGKGVTSGVASAESLFDEARSIALGQRVKARVLIAKNLSANPTDNLRRMLVASEQVTLNAAGEVTASTWVLSSRGVLLPDQVYFSEEFSMRDHAAGSGALEEMTAAATWNAAYSGTYFYYEFNAEGICTTPGASLVIGTGARKSATDKPQITSAGKTDFSGFVVWRSGSTSLFRGPSQISPTISTLRTGDKF